MSRVSSIRLGDLSVGLVSNLAAAIASHGLPADELLAQFGLDALRLATPDARLSIARYMRLGHAASQLTGNPGLGLRMGDCRLLSHVGLAGSAAAQAPTVREAARTLLRFEPLYASNYRGHSSFVEDASGAWLRFYSISPYNDYNRFVVDSVLYGWVRQLGSVAGQCLPIQALDIEFDAPPYAEQYRAMLQVEVRFGAAENRVRLSRASLDLPNPQHCPSTWQLLLQLCETQLQERLRNRSVRERVSDVLGPLLANASKPDDFNSPTLAVVARQLNLPAWTLRRQLQEENTQFRSVLNETRRDLALTYIRDTELAFGEIAYLLGFTSAEAFQRAFRRWCATTPGEYRRTQRG